jgi:hypothetical protein
MHHLKNCLIYFLISVWINLELSVFNISWKSLPHEIISVSDS